MSGMGLGLGMGLSQSAAGGSVMGKLDDAERRRRLEAVLATVGSHSGVISHDSIERLARRLGLEFYQETGEKKLMTFGGSSFAVDVSESHLPSKFRTIRLMDNFR